MNADELTPGLASSERDGWYLRRAQALMAARAELFAGGPAVSMRLAGIGTAPRGRGRVPDQAAGRQLSLPMPRERGRRQARMLR